MKCESYESSRMPMLSWQRMFVCWALVSFVALGAPLWGQSPLGDASVPDEPSADVADDEDTNVSKMDQLIAAEQDPLVLAIVESRPTTPAQWIHDVRTLTDLKRLALAKEYLKQFLAVMPDATQLVDIQSQFGSALFFRLSNIAELQPEMTLVADAVMKAAGDHLRDAARLAALVDRLNDSETAVRRSALVELVKTGTEATVPMIAVLADASRAVEHDAVRSALIALGEEAIDPLIATLGSTDKPLRLQVISVLGEMEALKAVPFLLRPALAADQDSATADAANKMIRRVLGETPARDEAIRFLSRRLDEYLAGSEPGPVDQDDQITLWIWDAAQQIPRQETFSSADASFLAAALVSEELHRLDMEDREFEQMYLATGLEVAARVNGYGRPLTKEMGTIFADLTAADPQMLEHVLQLALDKNMQGAAVAVIDVLGKTKNMELLHSGDGHPRLLARSLISPLPRVKSAAARAVMSINPKSAYAGSSYLPETLGFLSASGGGRRVLIGNPRLADVQQLVGFFKVLDLEVDSRQRGRDLMLQAVTNPDYVFVLIHDAIERPGYRELVQILRRDPRTADLPVGLLVRDVNLESAQWFAKTDALTLDLAPPQTQEDVAVDVRRLLALAGRGLVAADERMRDASFALDSLAKLAADEEQCNFYNLLPLDQRIEAVLNIPSLAAKAAGVLGLLGTPRAQRALVGFANNQVRPLADRQAAVAALRTAVSRRGLLLTRDQLLHQYDIYNASEFLDTDTQAVLASILDALEESSRTSDAATHDN